MANNVRRILRLRILQAKPDAVISFIESMTPMTVIATVGTGILVVAGEYTLAPREAADLPAGESGRELEYQLGAGPYLVGVGRLIPAKGFNLLIRAFATVAPGFPELRLIILGDGPERAALESLARQLAIADRVVMPGRVEDPHFYLKRAYGRYYRDSVGDLATFTYGIFEVIEEFWKWRES